MALSHGWFFRGHPGAPASLFFLFFFSSLTCHPRPTQHAFSNSDPEGAKLEEFRIFATELRAKFPSETSLLVFYDFLATPQRPWGPAQAPRTKDELGVFQKARFPQATKETSNPNQASQS